MLCADLLTRGYCKFGTNCLFDHYQVPTAADTTTKFQPPSDSPIYPLVPPISQNQDRLSIYYDIYSNPTSSSSSHTSPSTHSVALSAPDSEIASSAFMQPESVSSAHRHGSPQPSNARGRKGSHCSHKGNLQDQTGMVQQHHVQVHTIPSLSSECEGHPFQPSTYPPPFSPLPLSSAKYTRKSSVATTSTSTHTDRRSSAFSNSSSVPSPYLYRQYPQQRPFLMPPTVRPTSPNPDMEVYDFSDDEEGDLKVQAAVVEKPKVITMYECNKVGVLGGGVKLGFNARMGRSPSPMLNVQTQGDTQTLFDDSSADGDEDGEDDDDESEVEVVLNESPSDEHNPANIPLPPSTRTSVDISVNVSEILPPTDVTYVPVLLLPDDDPQQSSTSKSLPPPEQPVPSSPSSQLRKLSWAEYDNDDMDDDKYFKDVIPLFSGPSPPSMSSPNGVKQTATRIVHTSVEQALTACRNPEGSRSSSKDRRRERRAAQRAEREREKELTRNSDSNPKPSAWSRGPPSSLGAGPAQTSVQTSLGHTVTAKPTHPVGMSQATTMTAKPSETRLPRATAWQPLPQIKDPVKDDALEFEFPTLSVAAKAEAQPPTQSCHPHPPSPLRSPFAPGSQGATTMRLPPSQHRNRNRNGNPSRTPSTSPGFAPRQQRTPPLARTEILKAPQIYDRLGFALSPSAAREVEYLRVVESERLRREQQQQQPSRQLQQHGVVTAAPPCPQAPPYTLALGWQQPPYPRGSW
ncbi:hypothetical protein FRB94_002271 [Tulasnella sp. JGI-2019a]|nr:hypothetical protein FRB94_002271 [Tulasnella sp. JGI-2019a]